MRIRKFIFFPFLALSIGVACLMLPSLADDQAEKSAGGTSPDDAVRAAARQFADAFNRGDAKAAAALWTPDADYVDESGTVTKGRDEIEKRYAELFKEHPDTKIELTSKSIRFINADTALEDGETVVKASAPELSGPSRYTAVYAKKDGGWLLASVRDYAVGPTSNQPQMEDISWLIGDWSVEHEGAEVELHFRPIADGAFLEASYSVKRDGKLTRSGKQITGREPSTGQINSWMFNSDGSLAHGVMEPTDAGWAADFVGLTTNGEPTTAHNVLSKLDENAFSWKSVDRTAAGITLPDTDEVVVRRTQARTKSLGTKRAEVPASPAQSPVSSAPSK